MSDKASEHSERFDADVETLDRVYTNILTLSKTYGTAERPASLMNQWQTEGRDALSYRLDQVRSVLSVLVTDTTDPKKLEHVKGMQRAVNKPEYDKDNLTMGTTSQIEEKLLKLLGVLRGETNETSEQHTDVPDIRKDVSNAAKDSLSGGTGNDQLQPAAVAEVQVQANTLQDLYPPVMDNTDFSVVFPSQAEGIRDEKLLQETIRRVYFLQEEWIRLVTHIASRQNKNVYVSDNVRQQTETWWTQEGQARYVTLVQEMGRYLTAILGSSLLGPKETELRQSVKNWRRKFEEDTRVGCVASGRASIDNPSFYSMYTTGLTNTLREIVPPPQGAERYYEYLVTEMEDATAKSYREENTESELPTTREADLQKLRTLSSIELPSDFDSLNNRLEAEYTGLLAIVRALDPVRGLVSEQETMDQYETEFHTRILNLTAILHALSMQHQARPLGNELRNIERVCIAHVLSEEYTAVTPENLLETLDDARSAIADIDSFLEAKKQREFSAAVDTARTLMDIENDFHLLSIEYRDETDESGEQDKQPQTAGPFDTIGIDQFNVLRERAIATCHTANNIEGVRSASDAIKAIERIDPTRSDDPALQARGILLGFRSDFPPAVIDAMYERIRDDAIKNAELDEEDEESEGSDGDDDLFDGEPDLEILELSTEGNDTLVPAQSLDDDDLDDNDEANVIADDMEQLHGSSNHLGSDLSSDGIDWNEIPSSVSLEPGSDVELGMGSGIGSDVGLGQEAEEANSLGLDSIKGLPGEGEKEKRPERPLPRYSDLARFHPRERQMLNSLQPLFDELYERLAQTRQEDPDEWNNQLAQYQEPLQRILRLLDGMLAFIISHSDFREERSDLETLRSALAEHRESFSAAELFAALEDGSAAVGAVGDRLQPRDTRFGPDDDINLETNTAFYEINRAFLHAQALAARVETSCDPEQYWEQTGNERWQEIFTQIQTNANTIIDSGRCTRTHERLRTFVGANPVHEISNFSHEDFMEFNQGILSELSVGLHWAPEYSTAHCTPDFGDLVTLDTIDAADTIIQQRDRVVTMHAYISRQELEDIRDESRRSAYVTQIDEAIERVNEVINNIPFEQFDTPSTWTDLTQGIHPYEYFYEYVSQVRRCFDRLCEEIHTDVMPIIVTNEPENDTPDENVESENAPVLHHEQGNEENELGEGSQVINDPIDALDAAWNQATTPTLNGDHTPETESRFSPETHEAIAAIASGMHSLRDLEHTMQADNSREENWSEYNPLVHSIDGTTYENWYDEAEAEIIEAMNTLRERREMSSNVNEHLIAWSNGTTPYDGDTNFGLVEARREAVETCLTLIDQHMSEQADEVETTSNTIRIFVPREDRDAMDTIMSSSSALVELAQRVERSEEDGPIDENEWETVFQKEYGDHTLAIGNALARIEQQERIPENVRNVATRWKIRAPQRFTSDGKPAMYNRRMSLARDLQAATANITLIREQILLPPLAMRAREGAINIAARFQSIHRDVNNGKEAEDRKKALDSHNKEIRQIFAEMQGHITVLLSVRDRLPQHLIEALEEWQSLPEPSESILLASFEQCARRSHALTQAFSGGMVFQLETEADGEADPPIPPGPPGSPSNGVPDDPSQTFIIDDGDPNALRNALQNGKSPEMSLDADDTRTPDGIIGVLPHHTPSAFPDFAGTLGATQTFSRATLERTSQWRMSIPLGNTNIDGSPELLQGAVDRLYEVYDICQECFARVGTPSDTGKITDPAALKYWNEEGGRERFMEACVLFHDASLVTAHSETLRRVHSEVNTLIQKSQSGRNGIPTGNPVPGVVSVWAEHWIPQILKQVPAELQRQEAENSGTTEIVTIEGPYDSFSRLVQAYETITDTGAQLVQLDADVRQNRKYWDPDGRKEYKAHIATINSTLKGAFPKGRSELPDGSNVRPIYNTWFSEFDEDQTHNKLRVEYSSLQHLLGNEPPDRVDELLSMLHAVHLDRMKIKLGILNRSEEANRKRRWQPMYALETHVDVEHSGTPSGEQPEEDTGSDEAAPKTKPYDFIAEGEKRAREAGGREEPEKEIIINAGSEDETTPEKGPPEELEIIQPVVFSDMEKIIENTGGSEGIDTETPDREDTSSAPPEEEVGPQEGDDSADSPTTESTDAEEVLEESPLQRQQRERDTQEPNSIFGDIADWLNSSRSNNTDSPTTESTDAEEVLEESPLQRQQRERDAQEVPNNIFQDAWSWWKNRKNRNK